MAAMIRLGLTGGIGMGKSTAAELLAKHGAKISDSDVIARELAEPGQPALQAIAEAFGACKSKRARAMLLKIVHDKKPLVAGAAMNGLLNHVPEDKKAKRNDMRALIDIYAKVTSKAQGKDPDSKEREAYDFLKPKLDKVLNAYSGDEKLDSAAAWDAWLREQATHRRTACS